MRHDFYFFGIFWMLIRYYILPCAGELLGLDKIIPSFATARGRDILIGVNYASGGAGIRDETGKQLVPN